MGHLSLKPSLLGVLKRSDENQGHTLCLQALEVVDEAKNNHCNMVNNKVYQKLIQKLPHKSKKEVDRIMKTR